MQDHELTALLAEVGPFDDRILEIVSLADSTAHWAARFEHLDVIVANLAEDGLIAFSTVINGPDESIALAAYRAMMAANALWRTSGGLRFSLIDAGEIEISMILAATDVTPAMLAECILILAGHTANWSLIFSGAITPATADAIPPEFDPSFVRV